MYFYFNYINYLDFTIDQDLKILCDLMNEKTQSGWEEVYKEEKIKSKETPPEQYHSILIPIIYWHLRHNFLLLY